jgi:hypothetical protein
MNELQKTRVRKLVEALRSGEFLQSYGRLRRPPWPPSEEGVEEEKGWRYCCLGVGCELYRRETQKADWATQTDYSTSDNPVLYGVFLEESAYLPREVQKWYGFESGDPNLDNGMRATYFNDEKELNFDEIADLFEKEYLR